MVVAKSCQYVKNPFYLSYTSLKDFLRCPGAYYLKNIYRDPKTNFRLQLASPNLTLGSTVHDSIKWYLDTKGKASRQELVGKYRNLWLKYRGKRGGFASREEEAGFGRRGLAMLENFLNNAHRLAAPMPPLSFPSYHLIEDMVLIGNFDFVGLQPDNSLHIVDFKTGSQDEEDTLQLYIYAILAESNFQKPVSQASFWYLDRKDEPSQIVLDLLQQKIDWLKAVALDLKKAVGLNSWKCSRQGLCFDCRSYQALISGKGLFQFSDYRYRKDIYYLNL